MQLGEVEKEGVVRNDEKERGQGTTLLDPPKNVNPLRKVPPEKESNLNPMK